MQAHNEARISCLVSGAKTAPSQRPHVSIATVVASFYGQFSPHVLIRRPMPFWDRAQCSSPHVTVQGKKTKSIENGFMGFLRRRGGAEDLPRSLLRKEGKEEACRGEGFPRGEVREGILASADPSPTLAGARMGHPAPERDPPQSPLGKGGRKRRIETRNKALCTVAQYPAAWPSFLDSEAAM